MGNKPQKCEGNGVVGSVCQTILKAPISAGNSAACGPVDFLFASACDLAFGGPEDPVGDIVCGAATTGAGIACGKGVGAVEDKITKGKSYDPDKVTKDVCAKQFCNS